MRVLVFGDSITQGYWGVDGGWVERVRRHYDALQAADLQGRSEPTVFNLGISADNSRNVLERIESETRARTRHGNLPVIIVQIGVNDSSSDNEPEGKSVSLSIEEYEQNLLQIIEVTRPLCCRLIFVGSSACDESRTTPVAWGDYHYTNASIKRYEDKMAEIAATNGIEFLPLHNEFLKAVGAGEDLLPDGVHPNNAGHEFIHSSLLSRLDLT